MPFLTVEASDERLASARVGGRRRLDRLFHALCGELGFSLSLDVWHALIDDPVTDVESLTTRVLTAEGLDAVMRASVCARRTPRSALDAVTFMHVTWPDGSVIAQVEVSPSCDPVHTAHVAGTFEVGPGFERLSEELQLVQRLWAEGRSGEAFAASEAIDHLGICATDELDRRYRLFNIQFSAGLLFGAACLLSTWIATPPARSPLRRHHSRGRSPP